MDPVCARVRGPAYIPDAMAYSARIPRRAPIGLALEGTVTAFSPAESAGTGFTFGGNDRVSGRAFGSQRISERQIQATVCRFAVGAHTGLRERRYVTGKLVCLRQGTPGRYDSVRKTHRQCLIGANRSAGEDEVQCATEPDDSRKSRGAA